MRNITTISNFLIFHCYSDFLSLKKIIESEINAFTQIKPFTSSSPGFEL